MVLILDGNLEIDACVWEAAIKKFFLVARPPRPNPLPPFELSGHIFWGEFDLELQKKLFSLSGQAHRPPLLVTGPLKIKTFCGFPYLSKECPHLNQILTNSTGAFRRKR